MFKKKFPSLSSLGSDGNTSFLRAARAGHLDKVLEHLDKNSVDINTSNANGLNALHLASKDGHVHVVTELLKRGANVDSATKKGNTALHIASLAGQEDVVRLLVDNAASVNVQSQNGFTPLYMAAQENHDNVVKFLLASGANQSLATEDGFTPLAVAMQQGHDKVVAVLLENDSRGKVRLPALHIAAKKDDCKAAALLLQNEHNPDVTSKSGFTPLHIASHYGNEGIANLLLGKGADVNYSAKHNITPLHVAAKWGKSNMVSLLLEKGANIESKTRDGLTPLHCAARSGHEQVVDMLLERGAPISSKTKNGLAPLHMSSQGDHVDAARILLYHRAPVDEVTVDYLTALHVAAHCGHARVAKLLLDRKADPNARALNGFTPLHIACKKNRIKVVELLLKHGASIEATTESGLTPLHVASFMGCMNIVIYLLQNEASPDVPTVRGETPLHLAARANQTDIIRILLRNGAQVDARAREQQTPLHIAARLGNVDIVMLLLQHGAAVDSTTKDLYTALHIAAKEGQDEVASVLVENNASLTATTKKGFTPLHLAAKYGNIKVARLLLQRDAPVDAQGKNGVTPLHVASHYDHQNVALLLLDKGASPHATAKNGHTPLHIAAKKNQMDIATTLLEYGAKANSESKAGFTPLHLSAQEGHTDMSSLLIEHHADTNHKAKNGLTPLHLCSQEDRVEVAGVLVKNGAEVDSTTKAGYTPLHVASHFGQLNMVRFLVQEKSNVGATTAVGYTPLHQAAQQGHATIVNLLLENGAPPNEKTNQGQTALSIAQKLGYISVVETLKGVTEPSTITPIGTEEKYKVVSPETMQETFMSDSEDEGGEDTLLSEQPYRYLTVDEMKSLGDDSLPIDVTRDERFDSNRECMTVPPTAVDDTISPQHIKENYSQFTTPDNVDIAKHPLHVGFLVSFLVDARGGAMRGCRHSGVRVIVPPRRASMPMRVTCRYLKRDKLSHPPPLMEGEALASRILELGPVGAKFLGPVIIEVPHFGSLRGKEREIVILRSDNGETWREHTVEATDEAVQDVLSHSFEKEELVQMEDGSRTTRILTTDFPHYFAVVTRVRQEVHAIGPEGGMVSSSVVPQVQAVFPQGALTKKIKVGLQAQPIPAELAAKLLGNRVAVSPIVTVEPRRRKFHKPITLTIPVPQAANKGMINQYSGDAPTLRLLCSITGGTTRAQWEDVTGSTPLTFVNDCVSFTTTVSARFWLMDCRNIGDATKMATELYREAIHVPFMAKFVVFAKRIDVLEARLRVFCMTDDKEDKTLEHQEHFTEVAKSRDVEVLEGKSQYVEFAANLIPVTKSGEQLQLGFRAFRENRLPFTVRVKDPHAEPIGRTLFMREPKVLKGEPPQQPICVLNIVLPEEIIPETGVPEPELHKYSFIKDSSGLESYQRADLRLSDISNLLGEDWVLLAEELGVSLSDINRLKSECPGSVAQQGLAMLRFWLHQAGNKASANTLEAALSHIGRDDVVQQCIYSLDQTGFDLLKEELGPSRDASLRRNVTLDNTFEKDNMRQAEADELRRVQERILQKEGKEVEKDDKEERKYVAEEKEIEETEEEEEVKKSVSERRKEIEQRLSLDKDKDKTTEKTLDKRLSQETKTITEKVITTSIDKLIDDTEEKEIAEEKKVVPEDESKEPADLSFAEKRLSFEKGLKQEKAKAEEKYVDQKFIFEEQKVSAVEKLPEPVEPPLSFAEKRLSFEQGLSAKEKVSSFDEKVKVSEILIKSESVDIEVEKKIPIVNEEKFLADQRRDSALFEGVTETLGRLDMGAYAPQQQALLSPKVSKTPPPSPAEFKESTTGTTAWQAPPAQVSPEKTQSAPDWANKSYKQDSGTIDLSSESIQPLEEKDKKPIKIEEPNRLHTEIKLMKNIPESTIEQIHGEIVHKKHETIEDKVDIKDSNIKKLPQHKNVNFMFIAEEKKELTKGTGTSTVLQDSSEKSETKKTITKEELSETKNISEKQLADIQKEKPQLKQSPLSEKNISQKQIIKSTEVATKIDSISVSDKGNLGTAIPATIDKSKPLDESSTKILDTSRKTDASKSITLAASLNVDTDKSDLKTIAADKPMKLDSWVDTSKSVITEDSGKGKTLEQISFDDSKKAIVGGKPIISDEQIQAAEGKPTIKDDSQKVDVGKKSILDGIKQGDAGKPIEDDYLKKDEVDNLRSSEDVKEVDKDKPTKCKEESKVEIDKLMKSGDSKIVTSIDEKKTNTSKLIATDNIKKAHVGEQKIATVNKVDGGKQISSDKIKTDDTRKPIFDELVTIDVEKQTPTFKDLDENSTTNLDASRNTVASKTIDLTVNKPIKLDNSIDIDSGKTLIADFGKVEACKQGDTSTGKPTSDKLATVDVGKQTPTIKDESCTKPDDKTKFSLSELDLKTVESNETTSDSKNRNDKLTNILIDMLIEQETNKSPIYEDITPTSISQQKCIEKPIEEIPESELQKRDGIEFLNKLDKTKILDEINKEHEIFDQSFQQLDKSTSSPQVKFSKTTSINTDENGTIKVERTNEKVVSYVTTPTMQRRKIGGSQRLSTEERPALREVTRLKDDYSSEENDECDNEQYTVTEPFEKELLKETQHHRKVTFRVDSEDDPNAKVSEESEEEEVAKGVEFEEIREEDKAVMGKDVGGKAAQQKFIKMEKLGESESYTETAETQDQEKEEKKIRRVERRFERMASETMESDPVATVKAEGEFQRMVSQLSTDEVNECLQLWDEGGLTPSSELDSRDVTEGDPEEEFESLPQESSRSLPQEQEQRPTDKSDFPPKPTPRTTSKPETLDDDDSGKQEHPTAQTDEDDDAQDYSVRKKFWEQMSSGSIETAESKVTKPQEPSVTPPVPRPRASIVSTVSLLKSEAESDTETTVTTLSDSTIRLKNIQQDAISKQSFTGSSDASDKEEGSETDAVDSATPASVPTTAPSVVAEHTEKETRQATAESSDSETEYLSKFSDKITYENSGFVPDEETATTKPTLTKKLDSSSLDIYEKPEIPVAATRKSVYERSVSLPTDNLDASASSVRAKKRYFEAQIKKEMVVDQLMTQLEEESSPEHKSINQKEQDMPAADPEAMVSRQIHSHIFSHEMDEQIESLVPENKHILEMQKEAVSEPITITEVADTHGKVDAKRTVKRTDSTSFEAEIIRLKEEAAEPKAKADERDSKTDDIVTSSVKNIRNIFEKKVSEEGISKYTKEVADYEIKSQIDQGEKIKTVTDIDRREFEFLAETELSGMAEVLQYKSEDLSHKGSDSLEVHIDKSEIEESEKDKDIDDDIKQMGFYDKITEPTICTDDEPIPSITVTLSGKQRTDSYSPGDSEDNQSEPDITPENLREKDKHQEVTKWEPEEMKLQDAQEPCVHTPEEHYPDTVWEVPVQQEPETVEQEIVQDIPIESQIIIEKEEEDSCPSSYSEVKLLQKLQQKEKYDISEEEARQIAEQVVHDIETKLAEKSILFTSEGSILTQTAEIAEQKVTEYLKQLNENDDMDVKLIESVLAKKQREQILKATRTDTTTSSMEITDEDLRSSGVETDNSPIESLSTKLHPVDDISETGSIEELDKSFKCHINEAMRDKEVLEKTLAEVKESLEAAQEELIEEHKKKQDKIQKKESPSEFEFKVLAIDKMKDGSIKESHFEEATTLFESEKISKMNKDNSSIKGAIFKTEDSSCSVQENIEESSTQIKDAFQDLKHATSTEKRSFIKETQVEKEETRKEDSSVMKIIDSGSATFSDQDERAEKVTLGKKVTLTDKEVTSETFGESKEEVSSKTGETFGYTSTVFETKEGSEVVKDEMRKEEKLIDKTTKFVTKFEDKDSFAEDGSIVKEAVLEKHFSSKTFVEEKEEYKTESKVVTSSQFNIDSSQIEEMIMTGEKEISLKEVESEYEVVGSTTTKEEIKRAYSEESQKSSQDESIKSPVGAEDVVSSSSSSGRRGDSDTVHTLERPEVVMRRHKTTGSTSGDRISKKYDRRSGTDYEPYSSSGESHYQSFEQTSESIRTPSRPCSSDIEGLIVGIAGTTGSSEYESAISHEASARSATSHEFHTAVSSLSSRESMKSLDSESSGNLASVEISSEASETLVPSAMELEKDMEGVIGPVAEDYSPPGKRFIEPYETDIPHHIIKGESPPQIHSLSDGKDSISLDNSADDIVSEDDIEMDKDKNDGAQNRMKRSHEMVFQPDSRSPVTEITDEKLGSSLEETASILSISSVSETAAMRTVIELSRTESEKMDGSATSDQLSLTVSGTSEQLSLSSESREEPTVPPLCKIESSTSTQPIIHSDYVSSVTITTSSVREQGIQSVCTQVTSQTESSATAESNTKIEEAYCQSNGPAQVEYSSEYDDVKEVRKRPGHRRNESTSFKPSMIPVLSKKTDSQITKSITKQFEKDIIEDVAESDKYSSSPSLTVKEGRNDEKKDIDESEKLEEESYHTEADQGFHRDLREARYMMEDPFGIDDEHEELRDMDSSRPQSQVSKSDSESGHRHMSSGLSDDRPDSELAELLKQCSSDATTDDPIERPKTPEPAEECEIKDDTPEFSSEAQASITELELEYSSAFSRSVEYEAHVSPIHEKPCISFETWDHEDEMAEAEAAFQMVPHVSPTIPSILPPTIPEDPIAEKHELETREMALKEEIRRRAAQAEATSPGSIPDITVTQHMAPLVDRGFHYPDLELEEAEVKAESTPDTPASISSKASSETETDQGREYILHEQEGDDCIAEEPDTADISATTEEKTDLETKHENIIERDSATDSPGSDSFELLEKPDLADDFVIIEEVGKEAHEQDDEGKSVRIGMKRSIKKSEPEEDIVTSPPAPATRMTDLKYYPARAPGDDVGPFPFESESPPTGEDLQPGVESEEGSPPSDEGQAYDTEVEAGKKWIEMQFQGEQASAIYGYDIEFEHGPLEDIKEEEAADFESSSKIGSVGSQVSQSVGSFGSVKESLSSTPDYDVLAGRKYFTRSGEHDDVSMSSLQEFERLEHMIALESTKTKSLGSQDSLNSSGNSKRQGTNKSGGDDISLSSLKEFEGLESACIAAEKIESKAKEEEALLSEIEEGHESQASESESCETISAGGMRGGDSDSDDYEKRMFEIDEIIRQAQTNVERFVDIKDTTEGSFVDRTESVGRGDSFEEVAKVPDLDLDQPLHPLTSTSIAYDSRSYTSHWVDESRQTTDSLETKSGKSKSVHGPLTTSADSLEIKPAERSSADAMSASTDSIEYQLQQKKSMNQSDVMTDSIELSLEKSNMMSDSLEIDTVKHTDSIDEEEEDACGHVVGVHDQSSSSGREGDLSSSGKEDSGEHNRIPPPRAELMLGSTDSLEPTSSTATHATYHYETDSVMSSSFTSGGSNTMVSSTETLDTAARAGVWFEDGKPYVTEMIEPETDEDFSHTIHRTVELPPEVHKVTFQGPDAEKALREYVERFAPGEDMTETQDVDEDGNVHIKRVIQRRIVIKPEQLSGAAANLSGPELEQYIKSLSEEQMLGDMETFDQEQTGVTESDYTHLMSSIVGTTSPSHSTETHRTYVTRHITSPSQSSSTPSSSTTKQGISLIQQKGEKGPGGELLSSADYGTQGAREGDETMTDEASALDNSSTTDKLLGSGGTGALPRSGPK